MTFNRNGCPDGGFGTPSLCFVDQRREAIYGLAVPVTASYCDPAGRAANVQTAESEFEVFQREGLIPVGKSSAVRDGCVRIMDALADETLPMMVAERCGGLIRALSQVKPKRSQSEIYDTDHARSLVGALGQSLVRARQVQARGAAVPHH